jgi:hypothetical protein
MLERDSIYPHPDYDQRPGRSHPLFPASHKTPMTPDILRTENDLNIIRNTTERGSRRVQLTSP